MSILKDIKKGVEQSGSNKGKLLYVKADSKVRIRFLQEIEDGVKVLMHDSFKQGITAVCQELLGKDCPYCDDEELRHREAYVYSVWDYDASEIKLFVGYPNAFNPLPSLVAMYESYGTLMDRDFVIQKDGKGMDSRISVIPMDKVRFKNKKAKPYSEKKRLEILDKAYPVESSSSSGSKKKRPKEIEEDEFDDDVETNEEEYEEMTPRELYAECVERGLEGVKKKQKKRYYIDLLLEDDESDDEDDEDDDWDEEEEDDEDEW